MRKIILARSAGLLVFTSLMVVIAFTLRAFGGDNVETNFEKGKQLIKTGHYEQAVQLFSEALNSVDPGTHNALVLRLSRAQAYFGGGDLKHAFKDINELLRSDGLEGEVLASGLQLRGVLSLRKGSGKSALADFTAAIKTTHENESLRSVCFANRGITFINLGRFDEAVSDLNKAIELDPKSSFAYAGRGLAYLREDRVESSRRDAEKALSLRPDKETRKMAEKILKEMSASASGPMSVIVPISEKGHIFVLVRFRKNGTPHRFLLDTGATSSLIDRDLLEEIGHDTEVTKIGKGFVTIADGSVHRVTRYKVKTAFLFNLPLGKIEVQVFDKNIRRVTNLLGVRSLRKVAISIDNASRRAEIRRKESTDNNKEDQME